MGSPLPDSTLQLFFQRYCELIGHYTFRNGHNALHLSIIDDCRCLLQEGSVHNQTNVSEVVLVIYPLRGRSNNTIEDEIEQSLNGGELLEERVC